MGSRPAFTGVTEERYLGALAVAVSSVGPIGTSAGVTVAAGGTGIRHVATWVSFTIASSTGVTSTTVGCNVIDGVSGGTTFLYRGVLAVSGTIGAQLIVPHLHAPGTAATALTAEFNGGIANATCAVSMGYYDVK